MLGAEVFFAPNEKGAEKSNYKDALETAKDIKNKNENCTSGYAG